MSLENIKPLLVFSNAYDCEPVLEALKNVPFDQLHVNYFQYPYNYRIGQKFFLNHPEYTHYIIQSPDLVPVAADIPEMLKEVLEFDYAVYGPCANVDLAKYKDHIISCNKLPVIGPYHLRRYRWMSESQRQFLLSKNIYKINTKFNGLAWAIIKRSLLEKIPLTKLPYPTDQRPIWEQSGGYACDLAFCHYCDYLGIEIKLDLRFKWRHLRHCGPLLVGKKPPKVNFIKYNN